MDRKTYDALKASIEFWKKVALGIESSRGTTTCALCHIYHPDFRDEFLDFCIGCPVREATGFSGCRQTPYEMYYLAKGRLENPLKYTRFMPITVDLLSTIDYAHAELRFLQSLVPAGGPDD